MKINILLNNNFFHDHCTYCFIYPIIKSINLIKECNININLVYSLTKESFDCDTLIIDSRFDCIKKNKKSFLEVLNKNLTKNLKLIFSDNADNSGQIKKDFLEICNLYWKGQILRKKNEYMKSHYGGRLFTDYYRNKFKVKDKNEQKTVPVKSLKLLNKIIVSWNMGLVDHGYYSHIKQKLFSIFNNKLLIFNSTNYYSPMNQRSKNISCRIGTDYARETVQFQRKKISKILKQYTKIEKISRFKYLNEIKNSKFVFSPFGWGELCPRDFETFLYGGILMKPEMKTIQTWPNWYIPYETYLPVSWKLNNLKNRLTYGIENYKILSKMAIQGQKKYLYYTTKKKSKEIFTKRFLKLIKN